MSVSKAMGFTAGALLGGLSAAAAYGSVSKGSQMFGPSVYRGPGTRKSIALTFDDGPSESTPDLLDYLEKEGVAATFFQCGLNVKRLPHVAGQVAAGGHEIGNHSYSHPKLPFKSRQFILREFSEAQKTIEGETGVQIDHMLAFAQQQGRRAEALAALAQTFIASIGPTCSESLRAQGLPAALEPSHPKMGVLVREAASAFGERS
jgi:peptidoglycan/xylan/chitin deacetylase (PgdA/CDA1 family)